MSQRKGKRKNNTNRKKVTPKLLSVDEVLKRNALKGKVGIIELSEYPYIQNQINVHLERASKVNEILTKAQEFKAKNAAILEQISRLKFSFAYRLKGFLGIENKTYKAIELSKAYLASETELRKSADKLSIQNAAAVNACIGVLLEIEGVSNKSFSFQEGKIIINLN